MSSLQLKPRRHHESDSASGIFANRNTLYRRFHQIHQIKQPSSSPALKPEDNRFQLFKNKLAEYLQSEKQRSFVRHEGAISRFKGRPPKGNRNKNYQSTYIPSQSPQQRLKLSLIRYLRSSSLEGGLEGPKQTKSKRRQTKIRIHTNLAEKCHKVSKKRSSIDSFDVLPQPSKTTQNDFMDVVNNRSVPICTINFVDIRKSDPTSLNKTVYDSYLQSKLGYTPQRQEQQSMQCSLSEKVFNFKTNKSRNVVGNQTRPQQVLIMDRSEQRIAELQKRKSQLVNYRIEKRRAKPIGMKISINNIQNVLGPWSKKAVFEEEEEQQCYL